MVHLPFHTNLSTHIHTYIHTHTHTYCQCLCISRIHANLLDRAGKIKSSEGGGSVTAISCVSSVNLSPTSSSYMTSAIASEASRSAVDHCIDFDTKLAMRKMFPAIDVLQVSVFM